MKRFNRGLPVRLGIDVGGTFTDVILVDEEGGQVWTAKPPTTPASPVEGALAGIVDVLRQSSARAADIRFVGHGTTIATNLIVEGKGATAALVTTRGFRDILEIRRASRHDRADLYDLFFHNPEPMVRRRARLEVEERIRYDGIVELPLTADVISAVAAAIPEDAEAIAVVLINAHANPDHERRLADGLRTLLPDMFVTASHEVNPEIFEYERTSTTVVNAVLGPRCGDYLAKFEQTARAQGIGGEILFMQSNGGLATPAAIAMRPVTLLESGPAGGVTAAAKLCERLGIALAITGDMGGTTFDVSIVRNGVPELRTQVEVETHVVRAPTIDIESIGAGGGSIAWIDDGGGLNIGPRSAGAVPGPVCYGRGGDRATVTDCNLILGYIDPASFVGGGFALDIEKARHVVDRDLAGPLGMTILEAARTVRAVANARMAQAMRVATVERGHDPRDFAYVSFGGGGPLHALDLAEELGIVTVIVPRFPGLFSAFGMLVADQRYDTQIPVGEELDQLNDTVLTNHLAALDRQLDDLLASSGLDAANVERSLRADCRYRGQFDTLLVAIAPDDTSAKGIRQAFEREHERAWHFVEGERPVVLVNLRLQAVIARDQGPTEEVKAPESLLVARGQREIVLDREPEAVSAYRRDDLVPGQELEGPVLIEEGSACLVVRAGWQLRVEHDLTLRMARAG